MRRLLTVLLLACAVAGIGAAGPAQAHNVLLSSDPKDGASLAAAPGAVTLVFDQSVRQGFAQISVTGADGSPYTAGATTVSGPRASVKLRPLPGGVFAVGYRILSSDGHPVSGRLTFTVTGSGSTAEPAPVPSGAAVVPSSAASGGAAREVNAAAAEAAANGGSGMAVLWIAGALLVLALGTVVALRRPSTATGATPSTTVHHPADAAAPGSQGSADVTSGDV